MSTAVVFQQMLVIFLLMAIGYYLFKKDLCSPQAEKDISTLVTMVCNPAVMLASAFDRSADITRRDVAVTLGLSVVIYGILIVLGALIPRLLRIPKEERKFYHLMTVYGNVGFIGIPVVSAVLGSAAVIYVTAFSMMFNFLIYTHGVMILHPEKKDGEEEPLWKKIFNIGTVAGILTLIFFWFQVEFPAVFVNTLSYAGVCTTFLPMVVLGGTLSKIRWKEIFSIPKMYLFLAIRLLAIPMICALVLRQFFTNQLMVGTIVLLMGMPAGNMPLMMARQYEIPCDVLAKGILLSTILSLGTITLVAFLL